MILTVTKILSLFVYPLSLGLFFVVLSLWGQLRGCGEEADGHSAAVLVAAAL